MGAMRTTIYTGVDGFVVVSHSYCQWKLHEALLTFLGRRTFSRLLVGIMRRQVMRNKSIPDSDKDFTGIKTIGQFDLQIDYKYRIPRKHPQGDPSAGTIYEKIPRITSPFLILGSDDDPFTFKKLMPFDEVPASQHIALMNTRKGRHVSFLCG
jgi:predicted alpha/beta-fold hydrolase